MQRIAGEHRYDASRRGSGSKHKCVAGGAGRDGASVNEVIHHLTCTTLLVAMFVTGKFAVVAAYAYAFALSLHFFPIVDSPLLLVVEQRMQPRCFFRRRHGKRAHVLAPEFSPGVCAVAALDDVCRGPSLLPLPRQAAAVATRPEDGAHVAPRSASAGPSPTGCRVRWSFFLPPPRTAKNRPVGDSQKKKV